jgi:hypothetical protein
MNFYRKIEIFINKYPTKTRVYISSIFALMIIYKLKDTNIFTSNIAVYLFVFAPIIIYYFVTIIFNKGRDT